MTNDLKISDIKYVFFDMDGTLLTSNKKPSLKTIEIIKKLKTMNINCSIATGRPYYFAQNEIKIVDPQLPIISCNGALIYDSINQSLMSFSSINKKISEKIFNILIENDVVFLIYTKEQIFRYKNNETHPVSKWFNNIDKINNDINNNNRATIENINNYKEFNIKNYDVVKFLIIYSETEPENYKKIENEINQLSDVYIVRSQNEVFDIMPKGLSKGQGLTTLHNLGLIDLSKTIVFGDAENDISMFKVAKWSVAMGNAQEATKKNASYITNDNDNEGIFNFFNKLINKQN